MSKSISIDGQNHIVNDEVYELIQGLSHDNTQLREALVLNGAALVKMGNSGEVIRTDHLTSIGHMMVNAGS